MIKTHKIQATDSSILLRIVERQSTKCVQYSMKAHAVKEHFSIYISFLSQIIPDKNTATKIGVKDAEFLAKYGQDHRYEKLNCLQAEKAWLTATFIANF